MSSKSLFKKVEKYTNKVIEKMDIEISGTITQVDIFTPSSIIPSYEFDVVATNLSIPMCTIKSTDTCPVGFKNSDLCVGQNDADVNTNMCVQTLNSVSSNLFAPSVNIVDTVP